MKTFLKDLAYKAGDAVGNQFLKPPRTGFGSYVNHGPRDRRAIALTFDDGPSLGSTEQLLDVLGELNAPATFFCVGENVRANPDLVRRELDEGHSVGGHSERHARGAALSLTRTSHIEEGEAAIVETTGFRPTLYRPPWGWLTPWEARRLHQRGYTIVGWDVYTIDWQIPEPPAGRVTDGIVRDTQPGSIICMHDAFPLEDRWEKRVTSETVARIVPRLRDAGFEFVTVDNLLGVPAHRPPAETPS